MVSAYGCSAETADIEFAWTRRHAIDKGENLGRHLIQAFAPGEVTPEEAHQIGLELAKEILGGKYEFVLTTHIDRGHIHNHVIWNAVSFADHKHYHSNKRSYYEIRRASDRLCKEHGLSVIVPGQEKGKSYVEHQAVRNGTSYKAKLKSVIDRLLPACADLEDLLRRLQEEGYEIRRGKYISCRASDQERFHRLFEVDKIQALDSVVLSYQEGADFREQRAFWVRDHIGAVGLQKGRLAEEPGLAAAGTTDNQNVLVPGILGFLGPACHGDALCLCHGDILEEIRIHIGGDVR